MKNIVMKIVICLVFLLSIPNVLALEIELGELPEIQSNIDICEYSEEYLRWLALPEEERNQKMPPTKCKIDKKAAIYNSIISSAIAKSSDYPETYSLVEKGIDSSVKDQMDTGSCWAFASASAVETFMYMAYEATYDLSERHIEYATSRFFLNDEINEEGHYRYVDYGGDFYLAASYLTRGAGPILEEDMPFANNTYTTILSEITNKKAVIDIEDVMVIGDSECSTISSTMKYHLMNYGSLTAVIYINQVSYLNKGADGYSYYYPGSETVNHMVTIVGWDDNYSRTNFKSSNRPTSDGAWLVKNSYGADWGDNGYFYISYEDAKVCNQVGGVRDADTNFADNFYYHDPQGMNAAMGDVGGTGKSFYAANVFVKNNDNELLEQVMVASHVTTDVEIYVMTDASQTISLDNAVHVASGYIKDGGYTTIDLENPVVLTNDTFAVIVEYSSAVYDYPIGVSLKDSSSTWYSVSSDANESYFSETGYDFTDFKNLDTRDMIATIRAKTTTLNYDITNIEQVENYLNNKDGGTYKFNITTTGIANSQKLSYKIYNENNNDVTNKFTTGITNINNNSSTLDVNIPKDKAVDFGTYRLELTYEHITDKKTFTIYEYENIDILKVTKNEKLFTKDSNTITVELLAFGASADAKINATITDPNGDEIASTIVVEGEEETSTDFIFDISAISNNKATATIKTTENLDAGEYTITFTLNDKTTSTKFTLEVYRELRLITIGDDLTIGQNEVKTLTARYIPINASLTGVKWESSDSSIVSVDQNGTLTSLKSGSVIITATSIHDSTIKDSITVTSIFSSIEIVSKEVTGHSNIDPTTIYSPFGGTVKGTLNTNDATNYQLTVVDENNYNMYSKFTLKTESNSSSTFSFIIEVPAKTEPGIYCAMNHIYYKDENDTVLSRAVDSSFCFEVKEFQFVTAIAAENIDMEMGQTININPTINPSNANYPIVSYTSSNTSVASVSSDGVVTGHNAGTAKITIAAQDGSGITKSIDVIVRDGFLSASSYTLSNGYLYIKEATDYATFISNLRLASNVSYSLINNSNTQITSGYVGTGYTLTAQDSEKKGTYIIVTKGDVTGDGRVNISDVVKIADHIIQQNVLVKKPEQYAAEVTNDGRTNISDVVKISDYILNKNISL